jgi:hypothetical protein
MRRLGLVLSAGALLLACTACGQNEEIGFGGQPPQEPGSAGQGAAEKPAEQPDLGMGSPNVTPPAGGIAVDKAQVDAKALPEGYPALVWTEADGAVVGAYGQAGGCVEATGSVTEQTGDRVVFLVTETTTSTGMCTMDIRYPPLTVKLDAPLGDRTVVLQRTQVGPS